MIIIIAIFDKGKIINFKIANNFNNKITKKLAKHRERESGEEGEGGRVRKREGGGGRVLEGGKERDL